MWRRTTAAELAGPELDSEVLEDVKRAQREWHSALWQFNEALGQDHVDYAIYSLEAAEKKLEMLLRKAKGVWADVPKDDESEEGKVNIG